MRFSIIIPTRDRPDSLDRCLASIASLDYPKEQFETLVVDDASNPPPTEILARYSNCLRLRSFRAEGRGPACARNRALQEALGEYAVFTDDDCLPQPGWLGAYERGFRDHPDACLGGRIVSSPDESIFGLASQTLISFLYDRAGVPLRFFCSNNLAARRTHLLSLGGFDETFPLAAAEDRDLCARWAARNELVFVPDAVVWHRQKLSARSFGIQHYRYGRGAYHFWNHRYTEGAPGPKLQSGNFYWRMLTWSFVSNRFPRAFLLSALLACSQVSYAAGYFVEKRRASNRASVRT